MKLELYTLVVLKRADGSKYYKCDFKDQKSAVVFLDSKIRLDEFCEGYIKLIIKKG